MGRVEVNDGVFRFWTHAFELQKLGVVEAEIRARLDVSLVKKSQKGSGNT
jgi:hypothetical protein